MKHLFIILLLILAITVNAQVKNQGVIIYEEVTKMKFEMTEEQEARMRQMNFKLPSSFTNEKQLLFSSTESLYKTVEKEEIPEAPGQGGPNRWMRRAFAQNDVLYQDLSSGNVLEQKEFMTKKFLIEGEENEKKPKWVMTGERKEILGYQCQKATLKVEPDTTKKEGSPERRNVESTIEAWFTMQIPVSVGPEKYKGLPGTILEMTTDFKMRRGSGKKTLTATKIDLRELGKDELQKPNKGKKVTREEYREIVRKKVQEMRENRGGRGGFYRQGR